MSNLIGEYITLVIITIMIIGIRLDMKTEVSVMKLKVFNAMYYGIFWTTVFTIISVFASSSVDRFTPAGVNLLTVIYFFWLPAVIYTMSVYTLWECKSHLGKEMVIQDVWKLAIPYFIYCGFIFTNFYTEWIYTIDPVIGYVRGPVFFLPYIVMAVYIMMIIVITAKWKKLSSTGIWRVLRWGVIIVFCFSALQIVYEDLSLTGIASVSGLLLVQLYDQSMKKSKDLLTNLYTRDTLIKMIINNSQRNKDFTMIVYSLTNFKMINERYGLNYGDELLITVSKLLKKQFPGQEVYRYSGDEFAIIVTRFDAYVETAMHDVYTKLHQLFHERYTETVLGVVYTRVDFPTFGKDAKQLISAADYGIEVGRKSESREDFIYDRTIIDRMQRKNLVMEQLKKAIVDDGFKVYYQPIFDATTGTFSQAEALLRMDPKLGYAIYPDEFIPVAEETGLITAITYMVVNQVCKDYRRLLDEHGSQTPLKAISINFPYVQFLLEDMIETVNEILKSHNILPNQIRIELTERAIVSDTGIMRHVIDKMQKQGYVFELDDFGIEYANLNVFLNLEIDIIKIDRSLIAAAFESVENKQFFERLISGIHLTHRTMIVEGVEDQVMLEYLFDCGCPYIQGYYFTKPLSYEDMVQFVHHPDPSLCSKMSSAQTRYSTSKNTYTGLEVLAFEKLEKIHQFYMGAINELENPVFIKNEKGEFVFLNKAYKEYFDVKDESMYINKSVLSLDFIPYEKRVHYQEEDLQLIRDSSKKHYPQDFVFKDGRLKTALYWSKGFNVNDQKGLIGEIVEIGNNSKELFKNGALHQEDKTQAILSKEEYVQQNFASGFNRRVLEKILLKCENILNKVEGINFVLMLDIDHFEQVNERFGYLVGNSIMTQFEKIIRSSCDEQTHMLRQGANFMLFLSNCDKAEALRLAEFMRARIYREICLPDGKGISASVGVTHYDDGEPVVDCIQRLDDAIYQAKSNGRNRTEIC